MPQSETKTIGYHPISRKYLRYLIEGLNQDDSGSGVFAQLAERLIHRRKCPNIVPATEPSAGGDYGQDARNQPVLLDSDGRFRLYIAPPTIKERWIFAFSIRVDWKQKLRNDAAKIVSNNLQPERIIFVTNQFISPESTKIDAEREIENEYGVPCEILDGQWILNQLYEQDYALAVDLLGCPPEEDPELMGMFRRIFGLKETGLAEEEAIELEQLKSRVQYRNRYTDAPQFLVQDLRRIGDILASYEAHLEEAIAWYEEALPEIDRLAYLPEAIELLYAYFKALLKLPTGPLKIFQLLPKFIDLILKCNSPSLYGYIPVWLHYLFPQLRSQEQYNVLYQDTLARLRQIDRTEMGRLNQAYLDEAILYLEQFTDYDRDKNLNKWLDKVYDFLQRVHEIPTFPIQRIADILGRAVAPILSGDPRYETCFELALTLQSDQASNFAKADTLRKRALAQQKAGQLYDAIIMASRAKKLWFNERSMRGYLLSTIALSFWYRQLGYLQAAEYELMEGVYLTTWQPAYTHPDLLVGMILTLGNLAMMQGRVLRAYRWSLYYYHFCHLHRIEPDKTTDRLLEHNLGTLVAWLYSKNRPVHDRLLEIADQFNPELLRPHKEIVLSNDEDFERWIEDLSPDEQATCRSLRQRVNEGDLEALNFSIEDQITLSEEGPQEFDQDRETSDTWINYDELAREQTIEWTTPIPYLDTLTIYLSYPRNPLFAQLTFSYSVIFQIWSVFLHREIAQLTFAFDRVNISFDWLIRDSEPLMMNFNSVDGNLQVELKVMRNYIKRTSERSSESLVSFFLQTVGGVIGAIVLDPPEEIATLLSPEKSGEVIDRLFTVASPGYIWETELFKRVLTVDYAS